MCLYSADFSREILAISLRCLLSKRAHNEIKKKMFEFENALQIQ